MTAPSSPATSPATSLTPELREDLRSYADLGGLTLTADTHAWYAAVDTVSTPEEARAASTVLAELRGRDLPAVRKAAAWLVGTPGTVGDTAKAVALLLRVRTTLAGPAPAAYETADLDDLVAATASTAWRKERGLKLSWTRRRALRAQARGLAASRITRVGSLHTALAAAVEERTEWAALAGADAGAPALPDDAEHLDAAARAAEAADTGLTALGRLLGADPQLSTLPFDDLAGLLDRLAADEGTLYRLPALRSLRDRLPGEGLAELYAELTVEGEPVAEEEPEAAAVTEAVTEAVVETVVVPEPRSEAEPEAAPAAEAAPEAEAEPEAAPEAETGSDAAPEADAAPEPEAVPEPEPEAAPAAEAESAPDDEPKAQVVPAAEPEAQAVPEVVVEEVVTVPEPRIEAPAPAPVVEEPAAEAEPEPAAVPQPRRPRRPRKPTITAGKPVTAYSAEELTAVVQWLDSDGEKRTDDELLRAAMKELGFARMGPRIKEALGAAVSEVRG